MECTENVALGYSISVGAPYGIDDVIGIGSLPARCMVVVLANKKEDRNSVAITNNVLICFSFIFIIFFNFLYV